MGASGAAPLALPQNSLEMQNLESHPRPAESETPVSQPSGEAGADSSLRTPVLVQSAAAQGG